MNRVVTSRSGVTKASLDAQKIAAEAYWYRHLPQALRRFTPAFYGESERDGLRSYEIEYLPLPTLAELFVSERLSLPEWYRIMDACDEFLAICAGRPAPAGAAPDVADLYLGKTLDRLAQHAQKARLDLERPWRLGGTPTPGLRSIAEACAALIPAPQPRDLTVWHGDLCFSNVLYDCDSATIRVIDPRGSVPGNPPSLYGDIRYDIAKLGHSIIGRYDFIVADQYRLCRPREGELTLTLPESGLLTRLDRIYRDRTLAGRRTDGPAMQATMVLLFLAMLPLHDDRPDHQEAFIANALRLFVQLDGAA